MRVKHIFYAAFAVFTGLLMLSCAKQQPAPMFSALDLNPKLDAGGYRQKVDNFLIIFDASGTMAHSLQKSTSGYKTKLALAKGIVGNMNQTLPDLKLRAGMRIFGAENKIIYGMTNYTRAGLDAALNTIKDADGLTPLGKAINDGLTDLGMSSGQIAVIIVSDGIDDPDQESQRSPGQNYPTREAGVIDPKKSPVGAAQNMKNWYGDKLCIYPVLVGHDPSGKELMDQLAEIGGCGFTVNADDIVSAEGMADFVEKVFLAKEMDSDGDGVLDSRDRCPDTPEGAPVDTRGCPLDSDGDGVYDYLDKCPHTARGTEVDRNGCPLPPTEEKVSIQLHVEFDFDQAKVRANYHDHLRKGADFLEMYPETVAVLAGHTDNVGTERYNLELSRKRAENVKNYLIKNFGVPASRLITRYFGESSPVAANNTDEGRQKNRRVDADISAIVIKR